MRSEAVVKDAKPYTKFPRTYVIARGGPNGKTMAFVTTIREVKEVVIKHLKTKRLSRAEVGPLCNAAGLEIHLIGGKPSR